MDIEGYAEFARLVKSGKAANIKDVLFGKSRMTFKNLNFQDEDGFTPLCYACMKNGSLDIVKMLIASGASADEKSSDDETPLYMATYNRHFEIAAELLAAGARVDVLNTRDRETALHCASRLGYSDFLMLYLEKGANINARTSFGETPLYLACKYNRVDVVYLLLTKNADRIAMDRDGKDALYIAGEKENKEVVQLLKAPSAVLKSTKVDVDREMANKRPVMMSPEQMNFKFLQMKAEEDAIGQLVTGKRNASENPEKAKVPSKSTAAPAKAPTKVPTKVPTKAVGNGGNPTKQPSAPPSIPVETKKPEPQVIRSQVDKAPDKPQPVPKRQEKPKERFGGTTNPHQEGATKKGAFLSALMGAEMDYSPIRKRD